MHPYTVISIRGYVHEQGAERIANVRFTGKGVSVKNKFFTRKFVPAQGTKVPESLQVLERQGGYYG